jgi:hypothetical protein
VLNLRYFEAAGEVRQSIAVIKNEVAATKKPFVNSNWSLAGAFA